MTSSAGAVAIDVTALHTDGSVSTSTSTLQPLVPTAETAPAAAEAAASSPAAAASSPAAAPPAKLSAMRVFWLFLRFGCQAFGGPLAQINMMKEDLVLRRQWVPLARFQRALAVYQALPGPEATELACYFGHTQAGRLGALAGGLGFVLPGFALMLLLSFLYTEYGLAQPAVAAALEAMQVTVSAMVFNSVHKLGDTGLRHPAAAGGGFSWRLLFYAFVAFVLTTMEVPFLLTLAFCGVAHVLLSRPTHVRACRAAVALLLVTGLAVYGWYVNAHGKPRPVAFSTHGLSRDGSPGGLFALGLLGGLLTFGGAYTVIPFIYNDVVVGAGVLTARQFLDTVAIVNVVPAPLVLFCTMVGYIASNAGGAVLISVGMMLPAFSFTIIGHQFFEKVCGAVDTDSGPALKP